MSNPKKQEKTGSLKESMMLYFKGVKSEWNKITWPERKQVIVESLVVLGVVFFFTIFVYIVDIVFKMLLGLIPK